MSRDSLGYFALFLSVVAAVIAFVIAYSISGFFIAPVQYRFKSPFAILLMKLGMAAGAAFWTFIGVSSALVIWIDGK
jgi:hypothetical protein